MQPVEASPSQQYLEPIDSIALIPTWIYWLTNMLGCWHWQKMGAPFKRGEETYCTCTGCGARRQFDVERSKHTGSYYYPLPGRPTKDSPMVPALNTLPHLFHAGPRLNL